MIANLLQQVNKQENLWETNMFSFAILFVSIEITIQVLNTKGHVAFWNRRKLEDNYPRFSDSRLAYQVVLPASSMK